ncbi:hypothetical protein A176_001547 [Myxococcus hansupus]|uniref:Uncharacterized protein n=1 Tax=Pseudomyxococcus hansupus TaxID=1297742 RepID=A0A0H4WTL7_9BACT|nr:hypothetical protein A176_001547 [Myxococcus hansupus]
MGVPLTDLSRERYRLGLVPLRDDCQGLHATPGSSPGGPPARI